MRLVQKGSTLTTTVGELIKKLKEFNADALVHTEGCDCTGNVIDVTLNGPDGSVLITRDDYAFVYDDEFNTTVKDEYKDRIVVR